MFKGYTHEDYEDTPVGAIDSLLLVHHAVMKGRNDKAQADATAARAQHPHIG